MFDIAEIRELTRHDEIGLDTTGDEKTALFIIISDTDDSFNLLVSMAYTQLFNLACEKAVRYRDICFPVKKQEHALYLERKRVYRTDDGNSERLAELNAQIKAARKEAKLCGEIEIHAEQIREHLRKLREKERNAQQRKLASTPNYGRRAGKAIGCTMGTILSKKLFFNRPFH